MTEKKECNCSPVCDCVKKFFVVALGSFVGMFFALCSFTAICHTPQFSKQFAVVTVSQKNIHDVKVEKKNVKSEKSTKADKPVKAKKEHKEVTPVQK